MLSSEIFGKESSFAVVMVPFYQSTALEQLRLNLRVEMALAGSKVDVSSLVPLLSKVAIEVN